MALRELAYFGGGFETARMLQEESLALARQIGDRGLMAHALEGLGGSFSRQGDLARARELLEESVELARVGKNKNRLVWALQALAGVLSQQGDPEQARPLWEECLLLARELRMPGLVGRAIGGLVHHGLSYEEAFQRMDQT